MSHNKVLLQSLVLAVAGGLLETKFLPEKFNDPFKFLSETSPILPLPRGYALIIILHSITLMWLLVHGLSIGAARSKYKELAKKDGEKNVEDRYSLPNLYVDGNTKHSKAFNCVQRSHQQIFETLHMYLFCSMVSGLSFPLTVSVACSVWLYSRMKWVAGYSTSEGDAAKRYSQRYSGLFWKMMIVLLFLSFATAGKLLMQ